MASPIRIDSSSSGVVIHCRACEHWSAFRFSIADARTCAEAHEALVHPELHHHRDARIKRDERARHAV